MRKLKNIPLILGSFLLFMSSAAMAAPTTVDVTITTLRAYTTGNYYVTVNSSAMDNFTTCTTVYKVNAAAAGKNAVIATLLTAYASGKTIKIETAGCTGWGSTITSVYSK